MTAPTTFAEAVAAVPHDFTCGSLTTLPNRTSCDCTRDARLAKGVEEAVVAACGTEPSMNGEAEMDAARRAFVEASR